MKQISKTIRLRVKAICRLHHVKMCCEKSLSASAGAVGRMLMTQCDEEEAPPPHGQRNKNT